MTPKLITFNNEAREKLLKGVNILAEAVASTLGPKGQNVALDMEWDQPKVVHDGVTVAREIDLPDPFENMGAQLVKGAAQRTNDVAGDGTTTATILAQSIVNDGAREVKRGANPMILKQGIDWASEIVVEGLKQLSKPVTPTDYEKVATISAQNLKIGKIIAEAVNKVGKDGVITVEEGNDFETTLEVKEGMEFDKGYISPFFMTNTDTMEANIRDAYILLADFRIYSQQEIIAFLENFIKVSKDLVIIAESVEGEALRFLVTNRIKGHLNVLCIKSPGFGERRKDWLRDIAFLTGAKLLSDESGKSLANVKIEDLGRATLVTSDKESTIIVGGKGKKKEIEKRVKQMKVELKKARNQHEKDLIQERLAKMTGGVAVITAGAATELEMRENKERIIDAVNATQSAIDEGVVPGGEVALLYAGTSLVEPINSLPKGDFKTGANIVASALYKPFYRLITNSGYSQKQVQRLLGTDMAYGEPNRVGFDVMSGQVVDMLGAGIIDPVKVTRNALLNASSVAGIILTTNTLVTPIKEKKHD